MHKETDLLEVLDFLGLNKLPKNIKAHSFFCKNTSCKTLSPHQADLDVLEHVEDDDEGE